MAMFYVRHTFIMLVVLAYARVFVHVTEGEIQSAWMFAASREVTISLLFWSTEKPNSSPPINWHRDWK